MTFGVFGFVYSVYASSVFQVTPEHPVPAPIAKYMRSFARYIVLSLIAMDGVTAQVAWQFGMGLHSWVLIAIFTGLVSFCAILSFRHMD